MSSIGFYLTLPLLYLLSILPFPVLYLISDAFCFLLYNVVGYRKKVVYQNLKNSFPHKTEKELKDLQKKFYSFLCDLFLETFKTLTISQSEILKRCKVNENAQALFKQLHAEKKSCILVMGHYGNWEWAGHSFSLTNPQQLYVIYHPLSNKHFDRLIYKMRARFGTKLYAMKDTVREMIKNKNEISATGFIADQTPSPLNAYWTNFLNQETPIFWGTEKIAYKLNFPVIYIRIARLKRGYYELQAEYLIKEPRLTKEGEISEIHTRKLESDIIAKPEFWLWSHRRWKHKRINIPN
jgi:KDO2-lipid IV(A) lauroyltransferase